MIGKITNKFKLVVMSALMLGATSAYDYHQGHHQDHQQHYHNQAGYHGGSSGYQHPPSHHTDDNSPIPNGKSLFLRSRFISRERFEVLVCCVNFLSRQATSHQ